MSRKLEEKHKYVPLRKKFFLCEITKNKLGTCESCALKKLGENVAFLLRSVLKYI
jgi:hypothetical protein